MAIIAPVDRSDRAATVVSEAEQLAKAFDDTLHVIHVLPRSEFVKMGRTQADSDEPIDMDQVREVAADIAADAAADLDVPHEINGLMGDPAPRVVDYATKQDARYIVVGGRKRSPAGKAIFGSVAQAILLNANSPVVSNIAQPDE